MSLNSNNPYYKTIKYVPQNEDERLFLDEYDFDSSMILKNNCLIWEYTFFGFSGIVKNWIIESLS